MTKAAYAVPEGYHTITPQLTLDNAAQGIDWYKKALGADEVSRSVGPDGKIMHAELNAELKQRAAEYFKQMAPASR